MAQRTRCGYTYPASAAHCILRAPAGGSRGPAARGRRPPLGTGSVAHRLGRLAHQLGDLGEAHARFTAAAEIERRAGAPP